MKFTSKQIADLVNGELVGEPDAVISGISGIKEAGEGDITFLANSKYRPLLKTTKASAIITSRDVVDEEKTLIRTDNPSLVFSKVIGLVVKDYVSHPKGIHPTAVIADSAELGENVAVGPNVVIDDKAKIGKNTIIYGGCYIGRSAELGNNCLIYPNVTIRERICIGNEVILHSGVVIGSDGFGFAAVQGLQKKIPQIGTVVIEDGVEIGANSTIDRARFSKTVIGKGTKIDNLVQIAHNVIIGPNCIIVAQVGIAGSSKIGESVILAGQAGIVGHITVGDRAIVAGQAGVTRSVSADAKVSGYPARPHVEAKKVNACVQRLPQVYEKIKELEEKVLGLEQILKEKG